MANEWLRLWHDMPNDPKFKTIARISKQPISLVLSVYLHMLVDASRNVTRGHVNVTVEDLASALDVTEDQIDAIFSAMNDRLLDGTLLKGWESRQLKKEDPGNVNASAKSPAERKRDQRERDELAKVTECHDMSRDVTTDKDKDKDKDKEPDQKTGPVAILPHVALSIEFRKNGVPSKPDHPTLPALVAQGITPEIVAAACQRAKEAKPNEQIGMAYVIKIIESWSREAAALRVDGLAQASSKFAGVK